MTTAKTLYFPDGGRIMTRDRIISIGWFGSNSFGHHGHGRQPNQMMEFFAVESDQRRAAAQCNVSAVIAFTSRTQAAARLAVVEEEARAAQAKRALRHEEEAARIETGTRIRAALEQHIGRPARSFAWSDQLIKDDRLSPACVAEIQARLMSAASGSVYDCRADGALYRVQWHPYAGSAVVELVAL